MTIYIASSWKNHHGVEMLTTLLRDKGHTVISWVENNYGENHNHVTKKFPFEEWVNSDEANQSFFFDTHGATTCDVLIYYAPAGKDACTELGAAWASGVQCLGLYAKGEDLGLMRKMCKWYSRVPELLEQVEALQDIMNAKRLNGPHKYSDGQDYSHFVADADVDEYYMNQQPSYDKILKVHIEKCGKARLSNRIKALYKQAALEYAEQYHLWMENKKWLSYDKQRPMDNMYVLAYSPEYYDKIECQDSIRIGWVDGSIFYTVFLGEFGFETNDTHPPVMWRYLPEPPEAP